jgi:hypothetical protein
MKGDMDDVGAWQKGREGTPGSLERSQGAGRKMCQVSSCERKEDFLTFHTSFLKCKFLSLPFVFSSVERLGARLHWTRRGISFSWKKK